LQKEGRSSRESKYTKRPREGARNAGPKRGGRITHQAGQLMKKRHIGSAFFERIQGPDDRGTASGGGEVSKPRTREGGLGGVENRSNAG